MRSNNVLDAPNRSNVAPKIRQSKKCILTTANETRQSIELCDVEVIGNELCDVEASKDHRRGRHVEASVMLSFNISIK